MQQQQQQQQQNTRAFRDQFDLPRLSFGVFPRLRYTSCKCLSTCNIETRIQLPLPLEEPERKQKMAKGTVNWDSQETWQRIVAAIIATGVKQVAIHFGTTYDTIQHRFRTIKIEAIVLKEEVEREEDEEEQQQQQQQQYYCYSEEYAEERYFVLYTVSSSPAVKNSRISKPSSSTPKNRKKVIKEEEDADMPRHFDGEDELLGGGGGEGGDFSVGLDQEDHLGSGFLS
ncbi:uncharacterized protein SEPMUDRAFT_156743 [Sphaerulina musiva SO2202]|uniref:Uncharacterized protein n=1 Tax=Sphaerulina musiva (strain SO2202) TaxID=692275 RepID=N1QJ29_SPHMS|nr:uncharacterized protein SEPMUDRAFT_156743 [Sphaerulina musiva SO2202]EMF11810.1 hypothetical protein SEPMUDRAFT_156743 [Sphaerulina musiva SO2202]